MQAAQAAQAAAVCVRAGTDTAGTSPPTSPPTGDGAAAAGRHGRIRACYATAASRSAADGSAAAGEEAEGGKAELGVEQQLSSERRRAQSEAGKQKREHGNKGRTPWNKGKKMSEETKEKIRQATIQAMQNPELRDKLRAYAKNQKQTDSTRERISRGVRNVSRRKRGVAEVNRARGERAGEGAAGTATFAGGSGLVTFGSHAKAQFKHLGRYRLGRYRNKKGKRWARGRVKPGFEYMFTDKEREEAAKKKAAKAANARAREGRRRERRRLPSTKSAEHKRKISEAMKRKWQESNFRDTVKESMRNAERSHGKAGAVAAAVDSQLGAGASKRLDPDQQKDALERRARELLAMAEAALEARLTAGDTAQAKQLLAAVAAAKAQVDSIVKGGGVVGR